MRRQYEFSVDSFHIMLDTLFLYYECNADATPISDNFYPTVVAESMYGEFDEALHHLHKKLIATRNPEEIRGGGLLKYCNLLCRGYRPALPEEVKIMERYMCSRFFIDFSDLNQQQAKLENYLYNHFQSSEDQTKYEYLMILYQVVDESTVCLMGHERRLTLTLIEDMAYQIVIALQVYCPPPVPNYYSNNEYVAATNPNNCSSDLNLLSPASSNSSSSASSCCSLASCSSNMSTSSSSSSSSSSGTATPVLNSPPPPLPVATIPTYEIVTSCQPAVVYANGYYYTSFMPPPNQETASTTVNVVTMSPGSCLACSCNQWAASNSHHHQMLPQQS
jgi:hypothetical protein